MAAIYPPVRYALIILAGILFIYTIVDLVQVLDSNQIQNKAEITYLVLTGLAMFLGAYGSYTHHRTYIMGFALVLIVLLILGAAGKTALYASFGLNVLLVVLSLSQAELIRRGYH